MLSFISFTYMIDLFYLIMNHIEVISSILTLLIHDNPSWKPELQMLKTALKEWQANVNQIIHKKNKEILHLQTKSPQKFKLKLFLEEVGKYLGMMRKHYSDPNLKMFEHGFSQLEKEFQFIDVDEKFYHNNIQTQTESDAEFLDFYELKGKIERKQIENHELQAECHRLNQQILSLDEQIRGLNEQLVEKQQIIGQSLERIDMLRKLFQKLKKNNEQAPKIAIQQTYRSSPQFKDSKHFLEKKLFVDQLEELSFAEKMHQDTQFHVQNDGLWRMVFGQAHAIESIIKLAKK